MKTDLSTKALLTVIAVMLTLIAGKELAHPPVTVEAQQKDFLFAVGPGGNLYFYRPNSTAVSVFGPDGSRKNQITLGQ